MPNPQGQDLRVALLYQASQFGAHLRDALNEIGAVVVYEAPPADIDRDKLESSGARVVIVNLDADSDSYIDNLYDLLDQGDYDEVLFNDAQVSSNLSGWDHARWARNLAAKILRQPAIGSPPRPPGAEAVPTPVQKSASVVPVANKPSEHAVEVMVEAAPPAPSEPAAVASSERATVEMPLPEFVLDEPSQPAGLDIAALGEFADLATPTELEPAPAPAAVVAGATSDFAAELDALFANADAARTATPESDISLPTDFELAYAPLDTSDDSAKHLKSAEIESIDIPFDLGGSEHEPAKVHASVDEPTDEHAEFPPIFNHLDAAAATIPEAIDSSFKPGQRPPSPVMENTGPLLPPEWDLEQLHDEVAAGLPAAVPPNFGIEKVTAANFLAPHVEIPTVSQTPSVFDSAGPSFELIPMEEAIAPTYQNPNYSSESWLDGDRPEPKNLKVGTGAGIQRVFVLGASIGGPEAVRDFLGALPAGFPVLFILVQHMGAEFLELMSAQLAKAIVLTVRSPTHGERAGQGEILIVPTTHRLQVDTEGVVTLAQLPEKTPYSPSIDLVLRDVADKFGGKAGAIVFSGMAHDAIEGSTYLKSKGGVIWAQDPDTCVISSMVDGAREAGVVSFIGSPKQLAEKMIADFGKA